jgi:glycosyltransferase involved in cell wall biosynthesis
MISVCLTTYNGEKYLLEQINSIISQLSLEDELIVSDDGSFDNTLNILNSFDDKRIIIVNNNNQKGIIGNIENVLNYANGDFIFLSDQDDVWLPNKIKKTILELANNDLVISDCFVTDGKLNIIHDSFFTLNKSSRNKWLALLRNPYLGCCMAFNRKVLEDILPFPSIIPMHDIWIGNVAAFKHKVKFIDEKLIYYRRHGSNTSTAAEATKANILMQIKYRTTLLKGLLKLIFKKNVHKSIRE